MQCESNGGGREREVDAPLESGKVIIGIIFVVIVTTSLLFGLFPSLFIVFGLLGHLDARVFRVGTTDISTGYDLLYDGAVLRDDLTVLCQYSLGAVLKLDVANLSLEHALVVVHRLAAARLVSRIGLDFLLFALGKNRRVNTMNAM